MFLALPLHYSFLVNYDENLIVELSLSLLFLKLKFKLSPKNNLITFNIFNFSRVLSLNDSAVIKKSKKFIERKFREKIESKFKGNNIDDEDDKLNDKNNNANENKSKKRKLKFKSYLILLNKENISHIFKLIINIFKKLKADTFNLYFLISSADPYYNGLFLACFFTFKEISGFKNMKADIAWGKTIFKTNFFIQGKIIPLKLIFVFLNFFFSLQTFKILKELFKLKYKKGEYL